MSQKQNKISTAIIATAGWGTRWLPLTKSIEKCMLPVGTRPVIDWIVKGCVDAGITRIILVIGEGHTQIRQYFSHHAVLNDYLSKQGKTKQLELIQQPEYAGVHFEFVFQLNSDPYGTVVPLMKAADKLAADEPFLYFMGDDFVYRNDGVNEIAELITAWQNNSEAHSALMTSEVAREEAIGKYGVVITDGEGHYKEIIERPSAESIAHIERPSINISKYVFDSKMVHYMQQYVESKADDGQEYYITDVLNMAAEDGRNILAYRHHGQYLDAGTPANWLEANKVVMEAE